MDQSAEEIRQLLHDARIHAVEYGVPVNVVIDRTTNIVVWEMGIDSTLRQGEHPKRQTSVKLAADVQFISAVLIDGRRVATSTQIVFYPDGASSGGSLVVRNSLDEHRTIEVLRATGSVRIES